MKTYNDDVMSDFLAFSQRQYDCLDYDPFHPVMLKLQEDMDVEDGLWLSTFYMAFYNPASAWLAFNYTDTLGQLPDWCGKLPVGLQRRNLRGGLVVDYFRGLIGQVEHYGGMWDFLVQDFTGDPEDDWYTLQDTLCSVWGNGRWSSYTLGELYQKINNLPVLPTCIGNDGSSGPRVGLQTVMGKVDGDGLSKQEEIDELDRRADALLGIMRKVMEPHVPYLGYGYLDHAMVESELCDFQSLIKGRYYVGRDIDRMQDRIGRTEARIADLCRTGAQDFIDDIWDVRRHCFEPEYLGELQGWDGMAAYAKKFYRDHGIIANHYEIRQHLGMV